MNWVFQTVQTEFAFLAWTCGSNSCPHVFTTNREFKKLRRQLQRSKLFVRLSAAGCIFVRTSNIKISRLRLADYVRKMLQRACSMYMWHVHHDYLSSFSQSYEIVTLSSLLPSLFLRLSNDDITDSAIIWLVERGKYSCCTSGFLNVCRFLQNNNTKLSYLWFWREWMFYESNESMRLTVNMAIIYWLSLSSRFSN